MIFRLYKYTGQELPGGMGKFLSYITICNTEPKQIRNSLVKINCISDKITEDKIFLRKRSFTNYSYNIHICEDPRVGLKAIFNIVKISVPELEQKPIPEKKHSYLKWGTNSYSTSGSWLPSPTYTINYNNQNQIFVDRYQWTNPNDDNNV